MAGLKGEKYAQLGSLSLMPALSSWQTIIDAYFPRRVLSHYQKRSFTRRYSKRSNILWPTPIKSSVKISLVVFVWPYRGDQQLFVLWSSTQNAIRRLWGRRIYGKRLHSQNDVLSEEKKLTLINCSRWSIHVFEILKYW